jgi:cAMP-dependent protein kinase regulator
MGNCFGSDGTSAGAEGTTAANANANVVRETFAKAVEATAGKSAFIDFGHIFNLDEQSRGALDAKFKKRAKEAREGARRLRDVFAAPLQGLDERYSPPVHDKTEEEAAFISAALSDNFVFEHSSPRERKALVGAFDKVTAERGRRIIEQGDAGDYFYVLQAGRVVFVVDGKKVGTAGSGASFGELALLYNCPRAADVVADSDRCTLWRLDQETFKRILANFKISQDDEILRLLRGVAFLRDADDSVLSKMAGALHLKRYQAGQKVAVKGEKVTAFYIVKMGKIRATNISYGGSTYGDLDFGPGGYFGDRAIVKNEPFGGNAVATEQTELLCLSKEAFVRLFGEWEDVILRSKFKLLLMTIPIDKPNLTDAEYTSLAAKVEEQTFKKAHVFFAGGKQTHGTLYVVRSGKVSVRSSDGQMKVVSEGGFFGEDDLLKTDYYGNIEAKSTATALEECTLGVLTIKNIRSVIGRDRKKKDMQIPFDKLEKHRILGAGTFGRVWLVSQKGTKDAFALKIQVKRQLIEHHQAEGVIREKNIMAQLDSPFIISLSATYQDATSIYMLTKLYQGGELWSIIHTNNRDGLPEECSKFYMAGILEGLTHMHTRHIIYRDLKGENVLLDSDGYCVIIDLGFAKIIKGKTYTFCGTPLYLGE